MKKLILILTAAVFAVSCSDNLEDLNQNIKDPTAVSAESLFASAQKQLADQIVTPNVNLNNNRLWVQYLQETTYTDESNYDQVTRGIPDQHYREMYRDVLKDLDEARQILEEDTNPLNAESKANKLAITEIMSVFAWSNLVETFGDIPYSEALDIENLTPTYDDAFTVYKDLIVRLTTAINNLNSGNGSFDSSSDLIYYGDPAQWKKFGNTLKLRMGIMLSDVDPALSKSTVEAAYNGGVFTSNSDNGSYMYSENAPNNNPMNDNLVLSGRKDYVAAETIIGIMNNLEDPRRPAYFTDVNGEYVGGTIGASSSYANNSHVADRLVQGDEPGVLLSYVEAQFLLAEAAARGYSVGGDAESYYNSAITASFDFWNVEGVSSYLAKPEVNYTTALANSISNPAWKQVIGVQAWLGLYNRTFAPYLSVRRLDYPILKKPFSPDSGFPVRYTYPATEQTINRTNYEAAASAIGGDAPETQLFWDKFYTFDF
jgi:hypothetical protein